MRRTLGIIGVVFALVAVSAPLASARPEPTCDLAYVVSDDGSASEASSCGGLDL